MATFLIDLFQSIFTPGPTPTLLIATNVTFACLQVVLLLLLIATYSIHFAILSLLSAGLWTAINWFANELKLIQLKEMENKKRKLHLFTNCTVSNTAAEGSQKKNVSPGRALVALEKVRYTVQDVKEGRSPVTFVSDIILHGRASGLTPTSQAQLSLPFEHVEGVLRRDLTYPTPETSIEDFIAEIKDAYNIWSDIYKPRQLLSHHPFPRPNGNNYSNWNHENQSSQNIGSLSDSRIRRSDLGSRLGKNQANSDPLISTENYSGPSRDARQYPKVCKEHPDEQNVGFHDQEGEDCDPEFYERDYYEEYDGQVDNNVINNHINTSSHLNKLGQGKSTSCRKCKQQFTSNNNFHKDRKVCSGRIFQTKDIQNNSSKTLSNVTETITIKSNIPSKGPPGYAFHGFKYATAKARVSENDSIKDICLDTGCTMSLIDEYFFYKNVPQVVIMSFSKTIPVSGIGKQAHNCEKYV
ncbi:hypothetical protein OnM2_077009 [Erysiphe neolycopersici]|uniref:Uncharacterized protein n=1 Tax=Erysiphe neolycopersici TaxID=212602 RepID=A0A420HI53_9PEZI|nr:hypothetical protein OnM2_077009 [Erysiphe neolycopersici]